MQNKKKNYMKCTFAGIAISLIALMIYRLFPHTFQGIINNLFENSGANLEQSREKSYSDSTAKKLQGHNDIVRNKATSGLIDVYKVLMGKVILNPDKVSHIHPQYAGIVKEVMKSEGDSVSAGEMLAKIESNTGLQVYALKANHNGMVIKRNLSVGEFVNEEKEVLVVADVSSLWAKLFIRQSDLLELKVGQNVYILNNYQKIAYPSTISFISPQIDPQTRSTSATVILPFAHTGLLAGQFIDGHVVIGQQAVKLMVANKAIEWIKDEKNLRPVIYSWDGLRVQKRGIKVGRRDFRHSEIIAGLRTNEEYLINPQDRFKSPAKHHEEDHLEEKEHQHD